MPSNQEDELDEFIMSQLAFMDECNKQLVKNAQAFHERVCTEPSKACEQNFLQEFLMLFGEHIRHRAEAKGLHFSVHRVNLN